MMSFFDQNSISDNGLPYKQNKYKDIIEEQVLISYISQSLTFADTDYLCPYDRKIVLESLKNIKAEEKKQIDESMGVMSSGT